MGPYLGCTPDKQRQFGLKLTQSRHSVLLVSRVEQSRTVDSDVEIDHQHDGHGDGRAEPLELEGWVVDEEEPDDGCDLCINHP